MKMLTVVKPKQIAMPGLRVAIAVSSFTLFIYSQVASATLTLPLRSKKGMVVSAHPLASEAGVYNVTQRW